MLEINKIHTGNCLDILKTLPDESVNMCMTSPPYWALRDYQMEGQLGLEETFQEYISKLVAIFQEVKRVLKPDGTCWVNMGDTYSTVSGNQGKGMKYGGMPKFSEQAFESMPQKIKTEITDKCLLQIPSRFAIEMCNPSWVLREDLTQEEKEYVLTQLVKRYII